MNTVKNEFRTPSDTRVLTIFSDVRRFTDHCRAHFLDESEPWDQVMPRSLLKAMRKKLPPKGIPEWSVDWQAFYETIAQCLTVGIQEALDRPVFAVCRQRIERRGQNSKVEAAYYVAGAGFMALSINNKVRTAYFVRDSFEGKYYQYRAAWRHVRSKLNAREWIDSKGARRIEQLEVQRISEENWQVCPNPHRRPSSSSRRPLHSFQNFR